jgi:hypothetical protein
VPAQVFTVCPSYVSISYDWENRLDPERSIMKKISRILLRDKSLIMDVKHLRITVLERCIFFI